MKFPFLRALGPEDGWYKVGPLARVQNCDRIDTPLADAARREFVDFGGGRPVHAPLAYHWARMIEMLFAAEVIKDLLHDDDLLGDDLVTQGERTERGVGVIEAPRGTLIHHYRVDAERPGHAREPDRVHHAQQPGDERGDPPGRAKRYLDGRKLTEGAAQPHRGRHPRLRSVPVVRDACARPDAAGGRARRRRRRDDRQARQGRRGGPMLSLQPPPGMAPVLVLAIGNPSRGDDALGPLAAQRLAVLGLPAIEVLTDFQLQVEHALDLLGRELVVFIDAAVSGDAPYELTSIAPAADSSHSSHSLSPAAVLDACIRLTGSDPPPSRLLAIRGYDFELGAPLSDEAAANLDAALAAIVTVLRRRGKRAGLQAAPA